MRIFDNVTESSTVSFDVPVFEGYDAETGDLRAFSEAAQDMVGVYEAMHSYAMAELGVEQGTVTLEAAGEKGKNIFQRIVDALKKLWGKIRNFFSSIIAAFNAKVKSGKDFAKKYKEKVTGDLVAAEVYKYSGLSKKPIDGLFDKATKFVSSTNDAKLDSGFNAYKEQLTEEFRGELVGSGRCSEEQFREKAIAYMRGGDTKTEMRLIASNVFKILENTEAAQEANKAKTEMDKSFKNIIDSIQAEQKRYEADALKIDKDNQAKISVANDQITRAKNKQALFTSAQSICTMYFNIWKSVWAEREKAYKSIVVKTLKSK